MAVPRQSRSLNTNTKMLRQEEKKTTFFVSGGTGALLFIMISWSPAKLLMQCYHSTNDSFESRSDQKVTEMGQKTWQSDFVTRQCSIAYIKTGERHCEIAWMGHSSAPAVHP